MDHALACLLGLLGLRVSEACGINIEDLAIERGHRTVTVLGKGSKLALIPLPPRVAAPSTWRPVIAGRDRCSWPNPGCGSTVTPQPGS